MTSKVSLGRLFSSAEAGLAICSLVRWTLLLAALAAPPLASITKNAQLLSDFSSLENSSGGTIRITICFETGGGGRAIKRVKKKNGKKAGNNKLSW